MFSDKRPNNMTDRQTSKIYIYRSAQISFDLIFDFYQAFKHHGIHINTVTKRSCHYTTSLCLLVKSLLEIKTLRDQLRLHCKNFDYCIIMQKGKSFFFEITPYFRKYSD